MSWSQLVAGIRARGWRAYRDALAIAVCLLAVALLGLWVLRSGSGSTRPGSPAATAPSSAVAFTPHASPQPVADVVFQDAAGARRSLAEFRGRTVLLNLWATWCAPCRVEMPTLDRLQARLGGKDFEVVALSIDRDGASVVKRFFAETNVQSLAIYVDPTMAAQEKLGAIGLPTTLLIDREGREVARKIGPAAWDAPETMAVIRRYLPAGNP